MTKQVDLSRYRQILVFPVLQSPLLVVLDYPDVAGLQNATIWRTPIAERLNMSGT